MPLTSLGTTHSQQELQVGKRIPQSVIGPGSSQARPLPPLWSTRRLPNPLSDRVQNGHYLAPRAKVITPCGGRRVGAAADLAVTGKPFGRPGLVRIVPTRRVSGTALPMRTSEVQRSRGG